MLRNCFLPVDYNQEAPRTCGEIVYKNVDEFIIKCTFCTMKIFEFDEFIGHLKTVHLDELVDGAASTVDTVKQSCSQPLEDVLEENENYFYHQIKSEDEDNESKNKLDYNDKQGLEFQGSANDNDQLSDNDDKEYILSVEEESTEEEEEEQHERILRKVRTSKEYTCEICNKKYVDERRLQNHVKVVHECEKPFKCTYCNQSFAAERSLQSHIRKKHTSYNCRTCHKNYYSKQTLQRHMLTHESIKDFVCPEEKCGKAFACKNMLKNHQRNHNEETYICEECGYKCRKRDALTVHKRHHTGEKPYACNKCESRFFSKPLLNEHMATHTKERKHVCDVCGKTFNRPKALYHHKHLHLGIKKFICKICGSAYAQAAGLSAHMRKHKEDFNRIIVDDKLNK